METNTYHKGFFKPKFKNNFFLTKQEIDLILTLKKLHRMNNQIGNDDQKYSDFIEEMSCFYKDLLSEYKS
jgi:hypothetical protein